MVRRVLTAASVLSLLLGAAMVVLWVRSYRHGDLLNVFRRGTVEPTVAQISVYSGRGVVYLSRFTFFFGTIEAAAQFGPHARYSVGSLDPNHVRLDGGGMLVARFGARPGGGLAFAILPDWWIASALFLPCLIWLARSAVRRNRQRSRVAAGCCPTCGYDLRSSAERCPECGAPIPGRVIG